MESPLPTTIEITFTEEDRQKADNYMSNTCLIGTALRRMGLEYGSVGGTTVDIKGKVYRIGDFGLISHSEINCFNKPHYATSIVDKSITLTLCNH